MSVDGIRLVRFTDRERPYRSGSIALYAEDSCVRYGPVELRSVRWYSEAVGARLRAESSPAGRSRV